MVQQLQPGLDRHSPKRHQWAVASSFKSLHSFLLQLSVTTGNQWRCLEVSVEATVSLHCNSMWACTSMWAWCYRDTGQRVPAVVRPREEHVPGPALTVCAHTLEQIPVPWVSALICQLLSQQNSCGVLVQIFHSPFESQSSSFKFKKIYYTFHFVWNMIKL